MTKYHCF